MASKSQLCSGTWADLPQAPSNRNKPIAVAQAGETSAAAAFTASKDELPNSANMVITAIVMPRSPTRFITNALFAAAAADGLCCQNPISR